MIRIMYNPSDFANVFSVASILLKHEGIKNERCVAIPTKTKELLLNSPDALPLQEMYNDSKYNEEDDEYNDYFIQTNNYLNNQNQEEKIILVGIHPNNEEEEVILKEFVYLNREKINLWIDDTKWPIKILEYVKSENNNLHIFPELTCYEILLNLKVANNKSWLRTEKAVLNLDLTNKIAKRYLRAISVNKTTGTNLQTKDDFDFYLFMSIVIEIISKIRNPFITALEESFGQMKTMTKRSKEKLTDKNPIFKKAKKLGRPVGSMMLGKVQSYLDINELLEYGLKKYPWLCIVSATINSQNYLFMESKMIPIGDIMSQYSDANPNKKETLKLASVELLKYRPQRLRRK